MLKRIDRVHLDASRNLSLFIFLISSIKYDLGLLKEDDGYGYCSLNPLDSTTSIWIGNKQKKKNQDWKSIFQQSFFLYRHLIIK
jgi:hypothetical protein